MLFKYDKKKSLFTKTVAVVCIASILSFTLTSCGDEEVVSEIPADYGEYGASFARELADEYPYRKAFSTEEKAAGEMIKDELEQLGYEVTTQEFFTENGEESQNYIVHIEGDGFLSPDDNGDYQEVRKTVVIGAHYDSFFSAEEIPEGYTYDGLDDNASGVGCLMTIAAQIKNYDALGFDVQIVFFGAGSTLAGSNYYYNTLNSKEKAAVEVMFCVDGIYAGDKVYASAGLNSLNLSQKYSMRRKLYQLYDVVFDNPLYSDYEFSLYYNECGIISDINGDEVNDVYREVSIRQSDYVPFDNGNIAVVYIDSYDYFFDNFEDMRQTKNLNLQEFGGMVGGTLLDSTALLDDIYVTEDEDRLQVRINCLAYVILETMMKGSDHGITHEEYDALMTSLTEETEESSSNEDED